MPHLYIEIMFRYAKRNFELIQSHLKPGVLIPENYLYPPHLITCDDYNGLTDFLIENVADVFCHMDVMSSIQEILSVEFPNTWVSPMVTYADEFADAKHGDPLAEDHERKGGGPYIEHPRRVCSNLMKICSHYRHRSDPDVAKVLISALLHDTLEGTITNASEIKALFGEAVLYIVCGATKVEALSDVDVELPFDVFNPHHNTEQHYLSACDCSQDIKTADAIDNVLGFMALNKEKAVSYAEKKLALHEKMEHCSPQLKEYLIKIIKGQVLI